MSNSPFRSPHPTPGGPALSAGRSAALLIDFDNVTMNVRSDLGKELKSLLDSDVFRGKIAVRRAYADWRRYPSSVVPLTEASVDLIFAPAYGTSKKNATDLRMAVDAIELAFMRPEIGVFILLTGDSDFSSCVMKLKEYGKYVIGVGMRESASDLLIQNCDEYYSYHNLSGLTRATEDSGVRENPWELVSRAASTMAKRGDVMRVDRLKQVMIELDAGFNEKDIGYSKFSKFIQEAQGRGLLRLRRTDAGEWEVMPPAEREDVGPVDEARPAERAERPERGERWRDLGADLVERPIPRRDHRDDADRLVQHLGGADHFFKLELAQRPQSVHEMAEPGRRLRTHGQAHRRAHLDRDGPGDVGQACLVGSDDPLEQRRAFLDARLREALERATGCGDRLVGIRFAAERDLGAGFFGRGIDDLVAPATFAFDPLTVDIVLQVAHHGAALPTLVCARLRF